MMDEDRVKSIRSRTGIDLIKYTPDLPIVNASALPHGLGAKFLVTIRGEGKDLVAKRWSRVLPTVGAGEQIVYFGKKPE